MNSRHDLEIQGRFSASSHGPVDVMGTVGTGREALEKSFFLNVFFMISSNSGFSDVFFR